MMDEQTEDQAWETYNKSKKAYWNAWDAYWKALEDLQEHLQVSKGILLGGIRNFLASRLSPEDIYTKEKEEGK